jgi:hypothetical protein
MWILDSRRLTVQAAQGTTTTETETAWAAHCPGARSRKAAAHFAFYPLIACTVSEITEADTSYDHNI